MIKALLILDRIDNPFEAALVRSWIEAFVGAGWSAEVAELAPAKDIDVSVIHPNVIWTSALKSSGPLSWISWLQSLWLKRFDEVHIWSSSRSPSLRVTLLANLIAELLKTPSLVHRLAQNLSTTEELSWRNLPARGIHLLEDHPLALLRRSSAATSEKLNQHWVPILSASQLPTPPGKFSPELRWTLNLPVEFGQTRELRSLWLKRLGPHRVEFISGSAWDVGMEMLQRSRGVWLKHLRPENLGAAMIAQSASFMGLSLDINQEQKMAWCLTNGSRLNPRTWDDYMNQLSRERQTWHS